MTGVTTRASLNISKIELRYSSVSRTGFFQSLMKRTPIRAKEYQRIYQQLDSNSNTRAHYQFASYRVLVENGGSHLIDVGRIRIPDICTNDSIALRFCQTELDCCCIQKMEALGLRHTVHHIIPEKGVQTRSHGR